MHTPIIVAHRGNSSVAPQNTLAAFESAWRAGADSIEIDVQLTRDDRIVVVHDATVDATTNGTGALADLDLTAVRALDAGSWFATAYAGQRIPTLEEVIEFLDGHEGIDLLLEVKEPWTLAQVRPLTRTLRGAGLTDRVIVQSFWPQTVAALAEADPGLRRGLLIGQADERLLSVCADLAVVTCNPSRLILDAQPDLVGRLHGAGLSTMFWTLDEPSQWAAAARVGVDGIITNRPDQLAGWLAARGEAE